MQNSQKMMTRASKQAEKLALKANPMYLARQRKNIVIGLIVVIVIGFITFLVLKWRAFLNQHNKIEIPPWKNECPDYWQLVAKRKCKNIHRIGKCAIEEDSDGIIDFDKAPFLGKDGDANKCRVARACNVPWTGIDNLCI